MKKSIRLLLLSLLTPLLCSSVFAFDLNSNDITYLTNNSLYNGSFTNVGYYELFDGIDYQGKGLCVIFSGLTFAGDSNHRYSIQSTSANNVQSYYTVYEGSASPYQMNCLYNNSRYLMLLRGNNYPNLKFSVNKYWVIEPDILFNGYLGFDIQGLLDNLNQCDTSVQQCLIDKESLSGSLVSCNSDKESLTNYNEALSTQLNECLNNQGSGSNLSGLILNNNSLFWYLDDSLLSLPINNNLFLPLGYQGALDSGNVLYIKAIDEEEPENYYITSEDKVSIIDILSYIFVFFLGIGIIFSLIKLFKKIFTH